MYRLADIYEALKCPYQIGREINLLYHRRLRMYNCNPNGVDFLDKDWDNLVILDACRYDKFEELNFLPGQLKSITSKASSSDEFVQSNFEGKELYDLVILTANSWYFKFDFGVHKIIDYREENPDLEYTPQRFTSFVKSHLDEYPNKRLVIHYMTPHSPYFGETGKKYLDREKTVSNERDIRYVIHKSKYEATVDHLEQAYEENLEIVLKEVEELFDVLQGKTVVTADHGEMLGERHFPFPMRDYQHHHGIYLDELTKVPWLTYTNDGRKTVVSEEPDKDLDDRVDEEVVNERLRKMGYLN